MPVDFPSTNLATRVNGAGGQYNIANNEPILSVDSLLFFCQSRLNNLDTQIRSHMDGQKANIALQTALSKLQSLLPKGAMEEKDAAANKKGLDLAMDAIKEAKAAAMIAGDKSTYDALCKLQGGLCGSKGDAGGPAESAWGLPPDQAAAVNLRNDQRYERADGVVDKGEADGWVKDVEGMLANSRSNNEMSMISIQSLVSQRATALQLTTNMLNSMNESLKSIAANTGH